MEFALNSRNLIYSMVISVIGTLWLAACGGGPITVRQVCLSADDTECGGAQLERPTNPDLKTGRAVHARSLKETIADMRRRDPTLTRQITFFVDKSERKLTVKLGDVVVRDYGVSLGSAPVGHKQRSGDRKTPEGTYYVGWRRTGERGQTAYHRSLLISYPRLEDGQRAFKAGTITKKQLKKIEKTQRNCSVPPQRTDLGGYLLIHGGGGGPGQMDWTWGCIALNNSDVRELYDVAQTGCWRGQTPKTKLVIEP
jgi:murein L,D-transpeptidase YafK